MTTKQVRAWEIIEEDDGSETLRVEYHDGTADEFRGVTWTGVEYEHGDGDDVRTIPLTIEVKAKP